MPTKKVKKSYEKRIPERVHLWTVEVLAYINNHPKEYTAKDISDTFLITVRNAYLRLTRLRSWGMLRIVNRTRPRTYEITDWGKKFLKDRREKGDHE